MSLFKSKNAAAGRGLYVVVQHVPGAEPVQQVGPAWDHDAALTIFDRVIREAPAGYFAPHTGASMRVVALSEWNKSRLAEALLES